MILGNFLFLIKLYVGFNVVNNFDILLLFFIQIEM